MTQTQFFSKWSRPILIAGISLWVAGCGTAASQPAAGTASPSASHSVSHSKKAHKPKGIHVKGSVTGLSSSQIVVKTKTGTIWTFTITSHTRYRQKKQTIKASQIKPGNTVMVIGRRKKTSDLARVIRLL